MVVDSTVARGALEVLALPLDPATLRLPYARIAPAGAAADSVARYTALRDSVSTLDDAFGRARAALNRDAEAFRGGDRRAADYARRYAAWSERAATTERVLAARDRGRARLVKLHDRLSEPLRASLAGRAGSVPADVVDSAVAATSRPVVRARLGGGSARLQLTGGEWWVTVAERGGTVRVPAMRRSVAPGDRDTVRLGGPPR